MAVTALSGQRWQGVSNAIISPDVSITSASGWNTDNATSVTIDSSGIITGGGSSANDRIYYDFYSALGNNYIGSTFTLEWAMKRTSSSGQDTRPLGLTSGTTGMDDLGTSMNALSSFEDTNWNPYYRYGTTDSSGGGAIESPSQGTWYYMRMWRDGNVLKLEAYTDEDRDSQFYPSMSYGSDLSGNVSWSGNGNLRYLMSSTKASAGANHGWVVKDIKLWNNKKPSTNGSAGKDFKELDEKTLVTDVPTGSEFEQTNNYKTYQFKKTPTMPDSFGTSADGTISGGVSLNTTIKKFGAGSLSFNGASGTKLHVPVQLLPTGNATDGTSDFTFSCWLNWATFPSSDNQEILRQDYEIFAQTTGYIKFDGNATIVAFSSLSTDTWYNLVVRRLNGITSGYINYDEFSVTQSGTETDIASSTAWYIGSRSDGSEALNAKIDDVAVWHKAISDGERSSIYNSGIGTVAIDVTTDELKYYLTCNNIDVKNYVQREEWVERGTAI